MIILYQLFVKKALEQANRVTLRGNAKGVNRIPVAPAVDVPRAGWGPRGLFAIGTMAAARASPRSRASA